MRRSYYVEEKNQAITEREVTHGEPDPGLPGAALSYGIKVPHQPSRARRACSKRSLALP